VALWPSASSSGVSQISQSQTFPGNKQFYHWWMVEEKLTQPRAVPPNHPVTYGGLDRDILGEDIHTLTQQNIIIITILQRTMH